jgi:hypothetical protein
MIFKETVFSKLIVTMLIGILGRKGHGKDTIADKIIMKLSYEKHSFADSLKEACGNIFSLSKDQLYGDKKEVVDERWGFTPRKILQFVGTDLFRERWGDIDPETNSNIWIKSFENKYKDQLDRIIIADVRFQNEADFIKNNGGIIIKVVRPEIETNDNHISESIDSINYDHKIFNDSTLPSLYQKVDNLIDFLHQNN